MLLTMKALNEGGRAFSSYVAMQLDTAKYSEDAVTRKRAEELVALLTPVAKAFLTDMGLETTIHGQQIFGGHGFIREWGQEQLVRDCRITQIYEGTNGIQALDLVGRKGRMGFDELLAQARQRALEAQAHQDLPFEQLVEALQPERSLSHNPLFQVLFNYQSEARGNGQAFRFDELQMESVQFDSRTAQFDLTLDLTDEEQRFCAVFDYATDLFDASTVERLAGHWRMRQWPARRSTVEASNRSVA